MTAPNYSLPPGAYPWRIGHRGAPGHAPPNTIGGRETAARLGADMVELDVWLTKDGVAVLSHDPACTDDGGRLWQIEKHTAAELRFRLHPRLLPTLTEARAGG